MVFPPEFPAVVVEAAVVRTLLLKMMGRYSYLLTLVFLCFLCFALAEAKAKADTLGLPYNPDFEKAEFPYARVLSGCTDWRQPASYGDTWGPVSFASACHFHDKCFHTVDVLTGIPGVAPLASGKGASWGECNRQYSEDLRQACRRDLQTARLEKGQLGEPDPAALQLCFEIANLYLERAQAPTSIKRFEIAQKMEKEYLTAIRKVIVNLYLEERGNLPAPSELKKAMSALEKGQDIDFIIESIVGRRPKPMGLATLPDLETTAGAANHPAIERSSVHGRRAEVLPIALGEDL